MEKISKKNNKTKIGLIVGIASLIGIFLTILFPLAYNPLNLTFSFLYVVSMVVLTKGLIENRSENLYWLVFFSTGIITLLSFFTPAIYNLPGIYIHEGELWRVPNLRFSSWLWDYMFVYASYYEDFARTIIYYTPAIYSMIFIIIPAIIITFLSIKLRDHKENIIKYGGVLRTMANFLIFFPIALYFSSATILFRFWITEVSVGFAFAGPFFLGILLKLEMRTFQKNIDLPMDEYQKRRYKFGYVKTIIAGYALLIFSILVLYLGGALKNIMPSDMADSILNLSRTAHLVAASLVFISIFCALFSPRIGVITLLISGIFTLLFIVLINPFVISNAIVDLPIIGMAIPFQFLIVLLISLDLNKTRKIWKLSK